MKELWRKKEIRCGIWIALCFTLASTAYLAWVYHLMTLVSSRVADAISMIGGYLFQAAGMAGAVYHMKRKGRQGVFAVMPAIPIVLIPAVFSRALPAVLVFGMILNLLCGVLSSIYLLALAETTDHSMYGRLFGCSYAASVFLSWMISLPGKGTMLTVVPSVMVTALLAAAATWIYRTLSELPGKAELPEKEELHVSAICIVILLSLVKNMGFSFPSADITAGVNLELSRLFYGLGMIFAGILTDRDRRYGAVCTVTAMVIPFIMISFAGESVPGIICWGIDYFFYGIFSVFRVVLFLDLARKSKNLFLAPMGMLAGRVGDALGTALCMLMGDSRVLLILVTAAFFMITMVLFGRVYLSLYAPEVKRERSEKEIFDTFSAQHDLSTREREVLRLVLEEQTNTLIADTLCVSESTVKFHVHNLLQKTGMKTRRELVQKYQMMTYTLEK